jgi:hypothetical protein
MEEKAQLGEGKEIKEFHTLGADELKALSMLHKTLTLNKTS